MGEKEHKFWMVVRRCVISFLNGLEDYLGVDRTIPSRDERRAIQFYREQFGQK